MRTIILATGLFATLAGTALAQGYYPGAAPAPAGGYAAPAPAEVEEPQRNSLNDMISPVSSPTVNEDPRNTTEIRPIFIYHRIPDDFLLGSGSLQVAAVQLRAALTDRFSLIATKDGRVWINPSGGSELDGWANLAVGIKGSLLQREDWAAIVSAGLRYEIPSGNREVFQGLGKGAINPFISAAKGFGDFHMQLYTGPRLAITDTDSSFYDTNLHLDYKLPYGIYPLVEVNWLRILKGGTRFPFDQEASELVNLGSSNATGNVATIAFGLRYRAFEWLDFGATGEFPVTDRKDIFDWRVTWDIIIRPFGFRVPPWPWIRSA
jgi:hypothetical protein